MLHYIILYYIELFDKGGNDQGENKHINTNKQDNQSMHWQFIPPFYSLLFSEGWMMRLETLIELEFLNSSFSSSNSSIRAFRARILLKSSCCDWTNSSLSRNSRQVERFEAAASQSAVPSPLLGMWPHIIYYVWSIYIFIYLLYSMFIIYSYMILVCPPPSLRHGAVPLRRRPGVARRSAREILVMFYPPLK